MSDPLFNAVIGSLDRQATGRTFGIELTAPGRSVARGAAPASVTLPHAWHSGHRPTHFATTVPHSVQRYDGRLDAELRGMTRTLAAQTDRTQEADGAGVAPCSPEPL